MDSDTYSNHSSLSASDQESANKNVTTMEEDSEEQDAPQNSQLASSPEPPTLFDSSLSRGRNQPGTSLSVASNQTRKVASRSRAAGQLNFPVASGPRPLTTNLSMLIFTAVATYQKKSGLSMQALKKIITNLGYDTEKKQKYFMRSINGMVAKGQLLQVKGTGANGSFKVSPDMGKMKFKLIGRSQQAKEPGRKKKAVANSRGAGRNKTKKQGKETSRATKRNKITPRSSFQSHLKV